jgi:hypothetical protein
MNTNIDGDKILKESREIYRLYLNKKTESDFDSKLFIKIMKKKYKYLNDNCKTIFNLAVSDNYDYNRLSYMVNMAKKVNNDDISEFEASKQVGQILVDEIVKPQLDEKEK